MTPSKLLLASLLGAVALFPSCKAVEEHEEEAAIKKAENFKMHSPVVLVVDTPAERARLENAIVARLKARGMQPVASYTFLPQLEGFDVKSFEGYVKSHGNDSVIVADPFAAAEVDEMRDDGVEALYGKNFIAVAEAGWTDVDVSGEFGLLIEVWDAAGWIPVWIGVADRTFSVDASPDEVVESLTTSIEGERLL
jgi:hypothetical protein